MELRKVTYSSDGEPGKRGFEDLECFKLALDIVMNAHKFAWALLAEEKYDMASQIRRAAKCITANIAEGYGRYHYLNSLKFYSNARGSLNKTLGHLINAKVLNYCDQERFDKFYALICETERTLNGYMAFVRKQRAGQDLYTSRAAREESAEYETQKPDES